VSLIRLKQSRVRMLCLCLLLAAGLPGMAYPSQAADAQVQAAQEQVDYQPGEILVWMEPGYVTASLQALAGSRRIRSLAQPEVEVWQAPVGEEEALAAQVRNLPGVLYAEPNYRVQAFGEPNDPGFGKQWGHAQINSVEAWDVSTGSSEVVVAVIDSGVDLNHPDLAGKLVPGYDFVDNDASPRDTNGHGTFVAGIAAAQTNNGLGVAGMSWGARIMPLRVLNSNGSGTTADIIEAVNWAVAHGADIINMSFGNYQYSAIFEEALASAHKAGVLLVAAAGNDGIHAPTYPVSYPHVLGVGATDRNGKRAAYSNVSVNVDVMAPGGTGSGCQDPDGIYSTFPTYTVALSANCPKDYAYMKGTSFAAPAVAGLAAILRGLSPELGPAEVSQVITSTAVSMGGPFLYGYGRVDALAAVQEVAVPRDVPQLLPVDNGDGDGSYRIEWRAVPGATAYLLQEARDPDFSAPVELYFGAETSHQVTGKAAGLWYYRVRAHLPGGMGAWSRVQTAGVLPAAPGLASSPISTAPDEYLLSWGPVTGADGYILEEAPDASFSGARVRYQGPETGYRVTGQAGGTWRYRVRAYNGAGSGSWSAVQVVDVPPSPLAAPRLKEIDNGDRDGIFTLFWNDVAGASAYLVEFSLDPYFAQPEAPLRVEQSQLALFAWPPGDWYVRVRAVSPSGNGPWSGSVSTQVRVRLQLPLLLSGQ